MDTRTELLKRIQDMKAKAEGCKGCSYCQPNCKLRKRK